MNDRFEIESWRLRWLRRCSAKVRRLLTRAVVGMATPYRLKSGFMVVTFYIGCARLSSACAHNDDSSADSTQHRHHHGGGGRHGQGESATADRSNIFRSLSPGPGG